MASSTHSSSLSNDSSVYLWRKQENHEYSFSQGFDPYIFQVYQENHNDHPFYINRDPLGLQDWNIYHKFLPRIALDFEYLIMIFWGNRILHIQYDNQNLNEVVKFHEYSSPENIVSKCENQSLLYALRHIQIWIHSLDSRRDDCQDEFNDLPQDHLVIHPGFQ